jgi:hypothetical protein
MDGHPLYSSPSASMLKSAHEWPKIKKKNPLAALRQGGGDLYTV